MSLPPPLPPRQGLPPLPPALPAKPVLSDKWTAHKIDYDRMYLQCNGVLTRLEAFRLIGELERIAATL